MALDPIYAEPDLYADVLPEYRFEGMTDEDLLRKEVERLFEYERPRRSLELGCGTGRMTDVLRDFVEDPRCVDNSPTMLAAFRANHPDLTPVEANALSYIHDAATRTPAESFNFIAACWSLNYPLLECFEQNTGAAIVQRDFDEGCCDAHSFLSELTSILAPGGHLLTFFFDPDSAEQRFITDLWETVAPFPGTGRDFTRRILLEHLEHAAGKTVTTHYTGHSHARDLTQARRWFLKGHLKDFPRLADQELVHWRVDQFLSRHLREDGSVDVPVGVYVTTHTRATRAYA